MAYSELIKNFEKIRDYMREFYVYGFKSREEYDKKSARSYDDERRRIESWLGDYMCFRQDAVGKNVFLSVDSRSIPHNPLYQAFKAKSFTDNDIVLHFYILDLLADGETMTVRQIVEAISERYLSRFDDAPELDESTIRKKLKEYEMLGILKSSKIGRELAFSLTRDTIDLNSWRDAVAFYSEANPMGVIGSYLLDKEDPWEGFRFKHHYILHALDSEVLYTLLTAIREKRQVEVRIYSRKRGEVLTHTVYPLRIYISTQTGRQYLLGYHLRFKRPMFFRLDGIHEICMGDVLTDPERYEGYYQRYREHLWGVSSGVDFSMDHIEMTVRVGERESYIINRLEREKRVGRVEVLDTETYRFTADVYDATEMLPWLRTFIGRIVELKCSNQYVVDTFYQDLDEMLNLYGEGENNAVQRNLR